MSFTQLDTAYGSAKKQESTLSKMISGRSLGANVGRLYHTCRLRKVPHILDRLNFRTLTTADGIHFEIIKVLNSA